jgi:hypothetical protein
MVHPLDGINAKIQRADEQIKNLNAEISDWLGKNRHLYRTIHEADHDARQAILSVTGPDPPLRFSVIAGEIVHQLRSCLDHLVYQLVIAKSGSPDAKLEHILQFPICYTPQNFERARRQIQGVSDTAAAEIERRQPYHNKVDIRMHPLWLLRELDNADKHRLLVVCGGAAQPHTVLFGDETKKRSATGEKREVELVSISPPVDWPVRVTEDGTEFMRLQFGKYDPEMKVSAKLSVQVAFAELGVFSKKPVIYRLQELRDTVLNTIRLFDSEFS